MRRTCGWNSVIVQPIFLVLLSFLCLGTEVEKSLAYGPTSCKSDLDCDDQNACTADHCNAKNTCEYTNLEAVCDDGNACTANDVCVKGECVGEEVKCDDANVCTDDICNPKTGCEHANNTASCDDGDACTTDDACADGTCHGGPVLNCDDGKFCTDDSCDAKLGCLHANHAGSCDDGNACTSKDACSKGECVGGDPIKCDDGNECTEDSCDSKSGCVHENNAGVCDDGDACTTEDSCADGECHGGAALNCDDGKPCTDDSCDAKFGCLHANHEGACDDGSACTTNDSCVEGECVGGKEINCDDGNPCTDDACDPLSGCVHENKAGECDDGDACTTEDSCTDGACHGGGPLVCDDGKPCTDDTCDSKLGCVYTNHEGACDDENPCTTDDHCVEGECVGGGEGDCDDGLFCNGHEKCDPKSGCQPGENPCPKNEPCDEENDRCLKCIGDEQCDDGLFCNGVETCNPDFGCQIGDKPCGKQVCDEETDSCSDCKGEQCDDGLFCNGQEKCDGGICHAGPEPCGVHVCDEENDSCVDCTTDTDCDDGLFCNGSELCVEGKCTHGSNPCPELLCDEGGDACVSCTASDSAFCLKSDAATQLGILLGLHGAGDPLFGCGAENEDLNHAHDLLLLSLGAEGSPVIWGDPNHVDPAHGGLHGAEVFHFEEEACKHLDAYAPEGKGCPNSAVSALKAALSAADRILADTAIADAVSAGGDPNKIADAQALLAAGDAAAAADEICDSALSSYEGAWSAAVYSYAPGAKAATQSLVYASTERGALPPGPWIAVSTTDPMGYGSGIADFTRAFPVGSVITFTAPATHQSEPITGWRVNGAMQATGDPVLMFTVSLGQSMLEIVYGACEPQLFGDVFPIGGNGVIDVDDISFELDAFEDSNSCATRPATDLVPCDGTCDVIDVDDISAVLDAYAGIFACTGPCPP